MKKVMIAFREGGKNGGPYNSHLRIIQSEYLNNKYDFIPLIIPKGRLGVFNPKLTFSIMQQIKKNNPDIIHFPGLELIGFHVALSCKLLKRKNSLVAIHGSTEESISYNETPYKKRIISLLEKLTLKWTSYSYGVSEYVSSWSKVKTHSNNYFGHIYNMTPHIDLSQKKYFLRKELNINKDDKLIVSTGRIVKEKGYESLLKVIKNDSNSNAKYIIVGQGDYLDEMKYLLMKEIKDRKVFFLGYREDIIEILSECDIFVIATLHETLCMSLIEGGSMGLAMIATNVGGIPEIIDEGINGYLVSKENYKDFSEKIDLLVNDEEILNTLKKGSIETIPKKFDNFRIEKQIDSLYEGMK